jgi:hypothetical protein
MYLKQMINSELYVRFLTYETDENFIECCPKITVNGGRNDHLDVSKRVIEMNYIDLKKRQI